MLRLGPVVGVFGIGLVVLAGQTTRLTVVKGDQLLEDAQRRLVRLRWAPTVRGRILDRKGRVLAHDRPSFDVAVDFRVITGEWIERESASRARREHRDEWSKLSRAQRERLIERYKPMYRRAVDRMWDRLAQETGRSRAEIDAQRLSIREQVEAMARRVRRTRAMRELRNLARNHGISDEELAERAAELDRPDLNEPDRLLRMVLAEEITVEADRRISKASNIRIVEETTPRVIVPEVDDETGFRLRRLAEQRDPEHDFIPLMPGLVVQDSGERDYPFETVDVEINLSNLPAPIAGEGSRVIQARGVASHILGDVRRRVYKEDINRRDEAIAGSPELAGRSLVQTPDGPVDRGRYFPGDMVGRTGLERTMEDVLRGLRGLRIERVDRDAAVNQPSTFGSDVTLTLDIMLQARVQALLDPSLGLARVEPWHHNTEREDPDDPSSPLLMPVGTPLDAAAVVIDVDTGEILALVSTPTVSRTGSELPANRQERRLYLQTHRPWVNRAVSQPLPPGSIVKPLVLCDANARGVLGTDERIECTGHLYPNQPNRLRCWIYKQFGITHTDQFGHALSGAEAIKASCNIFFYTLGQRLGPAGMVDLYRSFGVGEDPGLPLDDVLTGWLGRGNDPSTITTDEAILMGIGQGPVAWTPVHAAASYATLARGGVRLKPTLLADAPMPEPIGLGFDPAIVDEALEGLSEVVNDSDGTANHITYGDGERFDLFDVPGITVWGKTGTATAPPLVIDDKVVRRGDHSWFVLLCGRGRPQYAIAVMTEYGGSGGRVSGPIANQIIRALVDEGYL
ncbi:MAG TPA: hypothetical protein ENJ00_07475 [Phycisphaerales bacterium]|nr:hypothetical protein [Phycisphaerales bacterium]